MNPPGPTDKARLLVSAAVAVLLAPLRDDRFLLIMDSPPCQDITQSPDLEFLSQKAKRRIGVGRHDLQWASSLMMHKRMARKLGGKNCFLLEDPAHLSSEYGREGLDADLMDAADLAWKLSLTLRGAGRQILLDSYAIERPMTDECALLVSDQLHQNVWNLVKGSSSVSSVDPPPKDPEEDSAFQRNRSMFYAYYAGCALVGEHRSQEAARPSGRVPGDRYPDRFHLSGTTHHVVVFGQSNTVLEPFAA